MASNERNAGAALCAMYEGMHTVKADGLVYPYLCPANYPTQGRGIVVVNMQVEAITIDEAERRFDSLFANYERKVAKLVKREYTPNQLSALACFAFNVGLGALKSSTLLRKFNRGDALDEVAAQFLVWNKAGGRVLAGLTKRRAAEASLFLRD